MSQQYTIAKDADLPGGKVDEPTNKNDVERVEMLDTLASRIEKLFQDRVITRRSKELEWIKARRLYDSPLGNVDGEMETPFEEHKKNRRRPVPNIVRTKCDAAIANSVSMQFAGGEKNWDMFPAPNEVLPENIIACRLMEKEIETQLAVAKYAMHSRRAMEDRVILGTGVMKGPVNTGKMMVRYEKVGDVWVPKVTEKKSPAIEYTSLWRWYPDMTVSNIEESNDAIEIHPLTALELSQYLDHPGFDREPIKQILRGNKSKGLDPIKAEIYNANYSKILSADWERNPYMYQKRYMVLEYNGPVTYDELQKLGIEPTYESPTMEYYGEVWVCCGKVIRMELENIEGYFETPYSVSTWKRDSTSVFGFGHPLLLADAQQVVTQSYHMILDNATISSGPQVAMYRKYMQPIDGEWKLAPGKFWLLNDPTVNVDNAIKFFYPPNVIGQLMPVLQLARQFADEESATPQMAAGLQSPENVQTATGGLMMHHAATTILDFLAEDWDDQVTEKIIRRMYAWNMQYNDKEEVKGDFIIDVKSSSEYKNKQMYIRDLERLQMESAQNPQVAAVVNPTELTRARLHLMHLPTNKIIRTEAEIQAALQQEQQKPDPKMLELQLKQAELEIEKQKLALATQKMQFEMSLNQQRAQWEHEEKMGANQARLIESQASVIKVRSESEIEMLKIAQRNEQFQQRILNDKDLAVLSNQAKAFIKEMELTTKRQENGLYQQELEIKRTQGSGI